MSVPDFLPYYVLIGTAGIICVILRGLHLALVRAAWSREERVRTVRTAAIILVGWLAAAYALGAAGTFHTTANDIPTIQYGILVPILIGALLLWRSPLVARIIDAVPQHWLVGVQLYRALGIIFLILYASGKLPGLFAWPAGVGDILVGVLAPVVALSYVRNPFKNGNLVFAWNTFGIADLIVAVTAGFVSAPSLLQPFAVEPPNELVMLFPLVLIPIYLVPLSVLLHLTSLTKLRRTNAQLQRQREPITASI
ncbi:MAG: hypothetical protein WD852_11075 [Methyloceanibacter sp.]